MASPQPVARRVNNPGFNRGLLHARHRLCLGGHLGGLGRRCLGVLADELVALAKHRRAQAVVRNGGSRVVSVADGGGILGYSRKLYTQKASKMSSRLTEA